MHGTTLAVGFETCSDLVLSSLVRARFGELISPKLDLGSQTFSWSVCSR